MSVVKKSAMTKSTMKLTQNPLNTFLKSHIIKKDKDLDDDAVNTSDLIGDNISKIKFF